MHDSKMAKRTGHNMFLTTKTWVWLSGNSSIMWDEGSHIIGEFTLVGRPVIEITRHNVKAYDQYRY